MPTITKELIRITKCLSGELMRHFTNPDELPHRFYDMFTYSNAVADNNAVYSYNIKHNMITEAEEEKVLLIKNLEKLLTAIESCLSLESEHLYGKKIWFPQAKLMLNSMLTTAKSIEDSNGISLPGKNKLS